MTTQGRFGRIERQTKETQIQLELLLDDPSIIDIQTPLPFFSHMLNAFACHGRFGLIVKASGDIEVDPHHLIEDVGIALGQAIRQAVPGYSGIERAGCFSFPMDGTLAQVALDLCGRSNLIFNVKFGPLPIGTLDPNLFREFYKGLVDGMAATLHIHVPVQDNDHHVVEATFKAFGRSLYNATRIIQGTGVLSTKGMIEA